MQNRFFETIFVDRKYCDAESAATNIESVAKRKNLKPFEITSDRSHEPAIIIGGGPSATRNAENIEKIRNRNGFKIVVGGGHKPIFNPEKPILETADAAVFNLPGIGYSDCVEHVRAEEYWIASACSPSLFHNIGPDRIRLLHANDADIKAPEDEYPVIGLGSTAATAGIALALVRGHREIECYGVDGEIEEISLGTYNEHEADIANDKVILNVGEGRFIRTSRQWWLQACEIRDMIAATPGATITFHNQDALTTLLFHELTEWPKIAQIRRNPALHPPSP